MTKKLIRIDIEESKRKTAGLSGYRRLLFYTEFEKQLNIENRLNQKKGGERVVAAMQEDGLDCTGKSDYCIDTIGRYQGRNHPYPMPMAILDRLGVRSRIAWVTPHRRQALIAWVGDP